MQHRFVPAVALLIIALAACDGEKVSGTDGGAGTTAGIGATGGAGGVGATGGISGTGSTGGICGVCPLPQVASPEERYLACCNDEGLCGISRSDLGPNCLEANAPGLLDGRCPTGTSPESNRLAGCCTRKAECGVVLDHLNLGCVERTRAATIPFTTIEDPAVAMACWTVADSDGGIVAGDAICEWARTGYCAANALCHVESGEPICECPPGFADLSPPNRQGVACPDINECLGLPRVCGGGTCTNTAGSFVCTPSGV